VAHRDVAEPAGPWQEPVRGGHPDPALRALPGLEQLREMLDGGSPHPPLSRLIGMRLEALGDGRAEFRMPVSEWLRAAPGTVPLGALAIPADSAMACAFMTVLPPFSAFTTAELSLRLLRAPEPGGSILARGRVVDVGPSFALTEAELRDERDRLIAHGSSRGVRVPARLPGTAAPEPRARARTGDHPAEEHPRDEMGPDPWERPTPERGAGPPPLELLTGLATAGADAGEANLTLPTSRWLTAPPPGRVQGGVTALLADASLSAAVQSAVPADLIFISIDLKVNYLRPLAADGRLARASARSLHVGRTTAVAGGEVRDADGRLVAVATGSGLVQRAGGASAAGTP
jgi:uncharacterized protein (TIGR00369 family)